MDFTGNYPSPIANKALQQILITNYNAFPCILINTRMQNSEHHEFYRSRVRILLYFCTFLLIHKDETETVLFYI